MNNQATQMDLTPYLPFAFGVFLVVIILAVINAHQRWNRIAVPFRTHKKPPNDSSYKRKYIHIDGRHFRNLVVMPVEEGLYVSHWGLLPQIMMPKRVMIPWKSMSDIIVQQRSALGFSIDEYYVDVLGAQKTQLKIPAEVAKETIQRNFLKQA